MFYITNLGIRFKKVNKATITLYIKIYTNRLLNQQVYYNVIINKKAILVIINLKATSNFIYTKTKE